MKVNLNQIKPSPHPIRTSWDEDKLNELAQSIKEQGLIVPIKVRPTSNSHYEIVYGHRRVEAARRAGLDEVEAIVEGVEDKQALLQQIIENELREDVPAVQKAKGYQRGAEVFGSVTELSRQTGINRDTITDALRVLSYPEDVQNLVGFDTAKVGPLSRDKPLTPEHVRKVIIAGNPHLQADILRKAAKEKLSTDQTRKVAEAVAATRDMHMKEQLINAPYSPYTHDPEMARERAARYGEHDPMARDKTPSAGVVWEATTEVKMMLDYLQTSRKMAEEAIKMDELGKFAPEARAFVARKARSMVEAWQQVIDKLEG